MKGWNKKRSVMLRYDSAASIYDLRYAEEQTEKIRAALKYVKMKGKELVLDVGCGTGILFTHVKEKAKMIVGLDFSKKTLLQARNNATQKNLDSLHLVQADADNMPFGNGVFDRVFAVTIVQNTPNPESTMTEITRVAKIEAVFVVTGLKKIFSRRSFEQLLKTARLRVVALKNEELKCYVAVCTNLTLRQSSTNVDTSINTDDTLQSKV